jgi:RND family efflux transporter MFP subunit
MIVRFLFRRVGLLLGVLLPVACGRQLGQGSSQRDAAASEPGAATVAAFVVDSATVDVPLELPAQLYVEHDAVVIARAAGTIDSIFVELGDRVTTGQTLARLESDEQEIALAAAEATFENLTRVAERARALTRSGGATAADSERAEFELRQAEIERRRARRDVELTRVRAPFGGVVSARLARPRRFVAVGDTLVRVTEAAPLLARVRVPEGRARDVRPGGQATVVDVLGQVSTATIDRVAPTIDAASATSEVVVRIRRPQPGLVAGASVMVRLGHERKRVIAVSREALSPEGFALVLEHGRASTRAVTVGAELPDGRVAIVSGLTAGERLARITR